MRIPVFRSWIYGNGSNYATQPTWMHRKTLLTHYLSIHLSIYFSLKQNIVTVGTVLATVVPTYVIEWRRCRLRVSDLIVWNIRTLLIETTDSGIWHVGVDALHFRCIHSALAFPRPLGLQSTIGHEINCDLMVTLGKEQEALVDVDMYIPRGRVTFSPKFLSAH
jgi:hypothetical protein